MRRYPQLRSTPAQVQALPSVGTGTAPVGTVKRRRGGALPTTQAQAVSLEAPTAPESDGFVAAWAAGSNVIIHKGAGRA